MQRKKLKTGIIALAALIVVAAVAAQGFNFIWNETPFNPTNYSWQEPWEVKEMVDFLEGTLTITGCAYQGQVHDVNLDITNVATVSNYYALSFAYTALWWVGETNQEVIIQGAYSGVLGIGESMIDTTTWQPSIIGIGEVKLNIIDIIWVQSETITWTTQYETTYVPLTITNFAVTGATQTHIESGTVGFTLTLVGAAPSVWDLTVTIVETSQLIAEEHDVSFDTDVPQTFTYNFEPLTQGGSLTMLVNAIKH